MKWTHNPFKSYKSEFDMSCKVMKSMAEEIIRLREKVESLEADNKMLDEVCEGYLKEIGDLREKLIAIKRLTDTKK